MASDSTAFTGGLAPKTNAPRPALPLNFANPLLQTIDPLRPPVVKFQVITRDRLDIIVGHVKIPTPGGNHAFILRRFDTGAISLTTMFRAAFPDCGEDQEKLEATWVKHNFDTLPAVGPVSKLRLAGTWVSPSVATALSTGYRLGHVLPALVEAQPDPAASYRKSARSSPGAATPVKAPPVTSPPAKRTRRESPAVTSPPPPSRRSARLTSPTPVAPAPRTPRVRGTRKQPVPADDEDDEPVLGVDHEAEIAESKALVETLKAKRDKVREAAHGLIETATANPLKRTAQEQRDGEALEVRAMNLDGTGMEVSRPVAGSRRFNINLNAEQKAMAWGTLAFAFGIGLTSFVLPMLTG